MPAFPYRHGNAARGSRQFQDISKGRSRRRGGPWSHWRCIHPIPSGSGLIMHLQQIILKYGKSWWHSSAWNQRQAQLNEASQQTRWFKPRPPPAKLTRNNPPSHNWWAKALARENVIKQAAATIEETTNTSPDQVKPPTTGSFTTNQASNYYRHNPDVYDAYFNTTSNYQWAQQFGNAYEFAETHFKNYGKGAGQKRFRLCQGYAEAACVGEEGPELVNFKAPPWHNVNETMAMIVGGADAQGLSQHMENLQREIVACAPIFSGGTERMSSTQVNVGTGNINATDGWKRPLMIWEKLPVPASNYKNVTTRLFYYLLYAAWWRFFCGHGNTHRYRLSPCGYDKRCIYGKKLCRLPHARDSLYPNTNFVAALEQKRLARLWASFGHWFARGRRTYGLLRVNHYSKFDGVFDELKMPALSLM